MAKAASVTLLESNGLIVPTEVANAGFGRASVSSIPSLKMKNVTHFNRIQSVSIVNFQEEADSMHNGLQNTS